MFFPLSRLMSVAITLAANSVKSGVLMKVCGAVFHQLRRMSATFITHFWEIELWREVVVVDISVAGQVWLQCQ